MGRSKLRWSMVGAIDCLFFWGGLVVLFDRTVVHCSCGETAATAANAFLNGGGGGFSMLSSANPALGGGVEGGTQWAGSSPVLRASSMGELQVGALAGRAPAGLPLPSAILGSVAEGGAPLRRCGRGVLPSLSPWRGLRGGEFSPKS